MDMISTDLSSSTGYDVNTDTSSSESEEPDESEESIQTTDDMTSTGDNGSMGMTSSMPGYPMLPIGGNRRRIELNLAVWK